MSGKSSSCCNCKPLVYYILAAVLAALALVAFSLSIVVMVPVYNGFIDGVDAARFIDNTYQKTDCENFVMGDATCGGYAYEAWLTSSADAYQMCLSDDKPATDSLVTVTGWCDSADDNCVKPDMCQKGMENDFYAFHVTNPAEVLLGAKPIVQELTPVHTAKDIVKHEESVDVDMWNEEGISHWRETDKFLYYGEDETELMMRKVTVPNFVLLSEVTLAGVSVNMLETLETAGALGAYNTLAHAIVELIGMLPREMQMIIKLKFGSAEKAMKSQYFEGGLTRLLGGPMNLEGELSLQPFAEILASLVPAAGDVANVIPPTTMGLDFFAYSFGCVTKQDQSTGSCAIDESNADDAALEETIEGTFSSKSKKAIWDLIYNTDLAGDPTSAVLALAKLKLMLSADELAAFMGQIGYAGAYGLSNYAPLRYVLFPITNPASDEYDSDYEFYPRFVKMTVSQLIGWEGDAFVDKVTGAPMTMAVAAPIENGNPTEQYRSSTNEDNKGLYYFKMYDGQTQSCAFDLDCMAQESFKTDGVCVEDDICKPNYAAGFDVKFVPGTLLGKGTDDFHKVGATSELFVGQIFSAALLKQAETDADWDGAKVDKWSLADIAFRVENCDGENPNDSRGIDCDSPYLSFDLGSFTSPMPGVAKSPIFASMPHFLQIDGSSSRPSNYYPGDRVDIIQCSGAEECEGERNFDIEVWTEPISGALVNGAQKLQMNVKFPPVANVQTGKMSDETLVPAFWLNMFQKAYPFQLAAVKSLQSAPGMFSMFMWILVVLGLLLVGCAVVLVYFGYKKQQVASREKAIIKTVV